MTGFAPTVVLRRSSDAKIRRAPFELDANPYSVTIARLKLSRIQWGQGAGPPGAKEVRLKEVDGGSAGQEPPQNKVGGLAGGSLPEFMHSMLRNSASGPEIGF